MHRRFFPTRLAAAMALAAVLSFASAGQGAAQSAGDGPKVGQWKTFVLTAPDEIAVPAPPADDSAQTKTELAELRAAQLLRSPLLNQAVAFWNDVPATRRWTDRSIALSRAAGYTHNRLARVNAILHTAMYDAVIAAYHAKYQYNRKPPGMLASDLVTTATVSSEPTYPSEHAAIAAAAAGVLTALFPKEEKALATMAQEAAQTRLIAGANYRSDIEAGMALGAAIAQKANARAAQDGSDAKFTGTIPTGSGYWVLPTGATPVEPLQGSWKPWFLTSGNQFRPGAPPAFGSPEFKVALEELKRINQSLTPNERALAVFWAQNTANAFYDAAYALLAADKMSTPSAARVLAFLAAAMHDSHIASHDAKYTWWYIRPSQADPTIVPVVNDPAHPSYPSNGAAVWGVAAEVLAHFFPKDAARLRAMAAEASISRLYAGIHYRFDIEAGIQIARRLAELVTQRDRLNDP
jgi:membrane-associated phospholipid phosphatase